MRYREGTYSVRRALALEMGKNMTDKVASCKCRNERCVNPDHLWITTRQELQTIIAKERQYYFSPLLRKRISDKARLRNAKITLEQALEIRASDESQYVLARRYGITQATVSSIKLGKTWRDYSSPFTQLMHGKP